MAAWSNAGVVFALLMGFVCPLSHFGGELLWFGANLPGIVAAALLSSLATWGAVGAIWLASARAAPWAGRLLRLAAALVVLVVAADVVVISIFDLRFNARDALVFGGDAKTWSAFIALGLGHMRPEFALAAILLLWLLASLPAFVWLQPPRVGNAHLACGLAAAAGCMLLGAAPFDFGPVRRFAVCSVWELMLRDTHAKRFSPQHAARVEAGARALAPAVLTDSPPINPRRPDIVILVIESWSSYHSRLFGGSRDWTPGLDAAAGRGVALTRCLANGFTTEDGLVAILAGEDPLVPPATRVAVLLNNFVGFHGVERSLPRMLARSGYRSYFFTNGPLGFSRLHHFLDSIGFDFLNDGSDSFYRQGPGGSPWPQGCFGAADEALYARVRSFLRGDARAVGDAGGRSPRLLVLETTSSHLPLTCPDGPPHTEERVMRYVDREAARFIRDIEDDGFFRDGGLLVGLSDHRAMLPIHADEVAAFGLTATWRIPLFFLADWLPKGQHDGRLASQADIPASLEWLTSGATPDAGRRGILLAPHAPPARFQAARVPQDRSMTVAWDTRTGAEGTIRWNGDRSSASPGLEEALLWLTWERIRREDRLALVPVRDAPLRHARWLEGNGGSPPPPH